jgi:hypothetical protein
MVTTWLRKVKRGTRENRVREEFHRTLDVSSSDLEHWLHERSKVASFGGSPPKALFAKVANLVASGIAVANDVVDFTTLRSSKLVALGTSTGETLRDIQLPAVWSRPAVRRGRVYVGTRKILLPEVVLIGPTESIGTLYSFGEPGEDELSRMGEGKE